MLPELLEKHMGGAGIDVKSLLNLNVYPSRYKSKTPIKEKHYWQYLVFCMSEKIEFYQVSLNEKNWEHGKNILVIKCFLSND